MIRNQKLRFNYRFEIQPLRTLSILLVAIYHIWIYGISGGVDVFLCLSGYFFVIHYLKIYADGGRRYRILDHFKSIIVRLLPTTLIFLFIFLLLSKVLFDLNMQGVLAKELIPAFTYTLNFDFIRHSYDYGNRTSSISPLVHLWAVNIILQLSIAFTIILYFADRSKNKVPTLLVLLVAIFCISFVYALYIANVNPSAGYFDPLARSYEFAAGGIIALLEKFFISVKNNFIVLLSLILFLLIGPIFGEGNVQFPGFIGILPCLVAAGILLFYNDNSKFNKIFQYRFFLLCGKLTFPFYLIHWPVYVIFFANNGYKKIDFYTGFCVLAISILVSAALLYLVKFVTGKIRSFKFIFWVGFALISASLVPVYLADGIQFENDLRKYLNDVHFLVKKEKSIMN